jgi:bifunctional DNase/RNase
MARGTKRKRSTYRTNYGKKYGVKKGRARSFDFDFGKFGLREKLMLLVALVAIVAGVYMIIWSGVLKFKGDSVIGPDELFVILPNLITDDYAKVEIDVAYDSFQGVVSLTSGCKRIVAYVEPAQAESIYRGINDVYASRPNSHDISVDAFENLDIDIVLVKITEIKDGAFYGKLILRSRNKVVELDARPSDATAIAVRMDAPIYINKALLDQEGEAIC